MRKINITKQDIVKPKALIYGLSLKQIVIMCIGLACAFGVFSLLNLVLGMNTEIALIFVFAIIILFAMGSIFNIDGTPFLLWIILSLKGSVVRNYVSKGVKDTYAEKEEK